MPPGNCGPGSLGQGQTQELVTYSRKKDGACAYIMVASGRWKCLMCKMDNTSEDALLKHLDEDKDALEKHMIDDAKLKLLEKGMHVLEASDAGE